MNSFEYANPSTLQEATSLLGPKWGDADVRAFLERPGRIQPDEHFLEGQRQEADRVAAFCIDTAVSGVQRDPAMNRSLHG